LAIDFGCQRSSVFKRVANDEHLSHRPIPPKAPISDRPYAERALRPKSHIEKYTLEISAASKTHEDLFRTLHAHRGDARSKRYDPSLAARQ
jgi:hypothetical protein